LTQHIGHALLSLLLRHLKNLSPREKEVVKTNKLIIASSPHQPKSEVHDKDVSVSKDRTHVRRLYIIWRYHTPPKQRVIGGDIESYRCLILGGRYQTLFGLSSAD
jgi:hypothetical protein